MTQPPQQPYGQQPQQPYGQQPQQPYGQFPQQPPQQGGFPLPPHPAAARTGNVGLGIGVAVVLLFVTAGIYGAIMKAVEHEIGYAAFGVGAVIGFAAGKLGGRNVAVQVVSALAAVAAVYLGQLTGYAMVLGEAADQSFFSILTDHFDVVNTIWKEKKDALTFVFLALGGVSAFFAAKRAAD
ncbi:hypothetical protein [Streptomyces sp. NPDC059009]|uniref:hypothetical protein n=1 Tax=Streptomyces sp. NPDC059009 TaxID=3346694 RepID=UPI0036CC7C26